MATIGSTINPKKMVTRLKKKLSGNTRRTLTSFAQGLSADMAYARDSAILFVLE